MVVTLVPSLPVMVAGPSNAPIAERYLYLPSIGFTICLAWAFTALIDRLVTWAADRQAMRRGLAVALVAPLLLVVGVFAYATVDRLSAYEDIEAYWSAAVRDNPTAGFSRAALAAEYVRQDRLEEAIEHYRLAATSGDFKNSSWRSRAWDGLGSAYLQQRDYEAALDAYQQALELDPESGDTHFNVAVMHLEHAEESEPPDPELVAAAEAAVRDAIEVQSGNQGNLMLLAEIALLSDDYEVAADAYREVLDIDGRTPEATRARQELSRLQGLGY
jgi:cytochrome c-type biogenesis protein CcmH/NrfG